MKQLILITLVAVGIMMVAPRANAGGYAPSYHHPYYPACGPVARPVVVAPPPVVCYPAPVVIHRPVYVPRRVYYPHPVYTTPHCPRGGYGSGFVAGPRGFVSFGFYR